jgi:serine/threonine protein kinase
LSLTPGTRLGSYEILAPIGKGGMGEVYRARDSKLNRDVALKILPDVFAADHDRLTRFTREAQTLAALNHPNIAQIHGLEDRSSVRALVMELVEGPDLAERLARGPIPVDETIAIARQVADAIEAAHEHGIVHRDLKPANIKVRDDGTVKVLDFGLAKAFEGSAAPNPVGPLSLSPTYASPVMTGVGMIMGTAAYMSPEQAKGKVVDKRADIWSFGVVLYEMLTGRALFQGETASEVLASVMMREPDLSALPPTVPAPVRYVIARCLVKDLAGRHARRRGLADGHGRQRRHLDRRSHPPYVHAPLVQRQRVHARVVGRRPDDLLCPHRSDRTQGDDHAEAGGRQPRRRADSGNRLARVPEGHHPGWQARAD